MDKYKDLSQKELIRLLKERDEKIADLTRQSHREKDTVRQLLEHVSKRFETIFEKLPVGIELYDKNGYLIRVNVADAIIFGITQDEALGVNIFEHPYIDQSLLQCLKEGNNIEFSLRYATNTFRQRLNEDTGEDKSILKYLNVQGFVLKNSTGEIDGYLFVVVDNTDVYCKTELIQDNLTKLRLAVDTGKSMIWEYDVLNDEIQLNDFLNHDIHNNEILALLRQRGFRRKKDLYTMIHPDDRDNVFQNYLTPLLRGKISNCTLKYRHLIGECTIWINANIKAYKFDKDKKPLKLVCYVTNITKEMELQEKMKNIQLQNEKIIQTIPDVLYIIDRNMFCKEVLSVPAEVRELACRVKGHFLHDILPVEILEPFCRAANKSFGEQREVETSYSSIVDGKRMYYKARILPFDDDHIMALVLDVTEKYNSERSLRMFEYAVSQSNDEIYAYNEDGRLIFANERVLSNYKLSKEFGQYTYWDLDHTYTEQDWVALRSDIRKNQVRIKEKVHTQPDGNQVPVELCMYRVEDIDYGELFWCFSRDITERKQQQRRINELNTLMDTILNNVPVSIVVKNVEDNFKYVYFNKAAEQFFGIKATYAIGKTEKQLISNKEHLETIQQRDQSTLLNGQNVEYAYTYILENGEKRIVNMISLLVQVGETPLLITLLWDITEQRKTEIELIKVREADKLKSAFLANMSHEIRTPLNAIVGFSSILPDTQDVDERDLYISIIRENNELLLRLISDILDFSRIETDSLQFVYEEVDVKNLFDRLYFENSVKMHPNVELKYDIHSPSVILYTDAKRLAQVLSNFIHNAIKFTEAGTITMSYEIKNNALYAQVCDTGIGIPVEAQAKIFDRFVKLNNFYQGTGLGLCICKMIIEKLDGTIGVESKEGEGSNFWFTLPLKQQMT